MSKSQSGKKQLSREMPGDNFIDYSSLENLRCATICHRGSQAAPQALLIRRKEQGQRVVTSAEDTAHVTPPCAEMLLSNVYTS